MGVIDKAVKWAVGIANDDSHGYDQAHRNGPDYDCSSLVCTAYNKAGLNIDVNGSTQSMYSMFTKAGFSDVKSQCNLNTGAGLKRGDVLLNVSSHACLVASDNGAQIVNASINENGKETGGKTGDQTGREIYVRGYYKHSRGWDYVLRY